MAENYYESQINNQITREQRRNLKYSLAGVATFIGFAVYANMPLQNSKPTIPEQTTFEKAVCTADAYEGVPKKTAKGIDDWFLKEKTGLKRVPYGANITYPQETITQEDVEELHKSLNGTTFIRPDRKVIVLDLDRDGKVGLLEEKISIPNKFRDSFLGECTYKQR